MSEVFVIGATSLTGNHFIDFNENHDLVCFSSSNSNYNFLDLKDENTFLNYSFKNCFLVSFAPIWLTQNILIYLQKNNFENLKTLKGIIVFSSTSAVTKKFASNIFDKQLAKKLINSENKILSICKEYSIKCKIIRPTIIYGAYKNLDDSNYSKIIKFFQKIPFCFLPKSTGYRQPIHFSQLSKLTFFFLKIFNDKEYKSDYPNIIEVGGDEELSYKELLIRLSKLSPKGSTNLCRFLIIPNKLFLFLIMPFLIFKPRLFDALYRMQADLSGFTKCSDYLGEESKKFPLDYFIDNKN